MIIGITGFLCAGKDSVASILMKKSFYHISLSDMIREECRKRMIAITRENLQNVGNELRAKYGADVLARLALKKIQPDKNYVITSIRTEAEAKALNEAFGNEFVLVFVDAPAKIRFQRAVRRNRENDPKTFEEFLASEAKEMDGNETEQQLLACKKLARIVLLNDSTIEKLNEKINKMLKDIFKKYKRKKPEWDAYFMQIARQVALRSSCIKRKVAAIVVKDKRILSTGYNGTPRGVKNCDEGGCPRCNDFADSGTALGECLCSHAEENAIVQAAYFGISLKESTLYSTFSPCIMCSKMIINAGIKKVVYLEDYPLLENAEKMLKEAGVMLKQIKLSQ